MPARPRASRTKPVALTDDDLGRLDAALQEGKRPRVYLRDGVPSLGIEPASSAQVVSVQGSTVVVRPKGVSDDVPFEAGELCNSRSAAASAGTAGQSAGAKSAERRRRTPVAGPASESTASASAPAATPSTPEPGTGKPTAATSENPRTKNPQPVSSESGASQSSKSQSSKPKPVATRVSVTISGNANGEWTVRSARGSHKLGESAPVAVDAVTRAVEALGDPTAINAVAAVRDHAKRAAAERVAELSAELARAEAALRALDEAKR